MLQGEQRNTGSGLSGSVMSLSPFWLLRNKMMQNITQDRTSCSSQELFRHGGV